MVVRNDVYNFSILPSKYDQFIITSPETNFFVLRYPVAGYPFDLVDEWHMQMHFPFSRILKQTELSNKMICPFFEDHLTELHHYASPMSIICSIHFHSFFEIHHGIILYW